MKRNKIKFMLISSLILFMAVSQASSQGIVRRPTIVIDFPNGGPDFQFYRLLDENDTLSRWRYTIHWESLVEYADTNQNGLFDLGTDTLVTNISFSNLDFSFMKVPMNLTGLENQVVTGSEMIFTSNGTVNSQTFFITIAIGWWNDVAKHPYGTDYVVVDPTQSKFSVDIENWSFMSSTNRLSILSSILTTTNTSSYDITKYDNGTASMITKKDPDGNGKRGGIINNPDKVFLDNSSFSSMKFDFGVKDNQVYLQYSSPSFTSSLLYDPTYSAVSTIQGGGSGATGVAGFEAPLLLTMTLSVVVVRKSIRN